MIKLKNILNEVLNTFSVQAFMLTDSNFNITDILEQIRAIRKITIVRNITPPEYIQKKNIEYTLVNIKFVTTGGLTTANTVIAGGTADVMEGSIIVAGAVVDVDAADQLNFVHTADNLGDFVEIISDGSNYYVSGNALNSGGITATG